MWRRWVGFPGVRRRYLLWSPRHHSRHYCGRSSPISDVKLEICIICAVIENRSVFNVSPGPGPTFLSSLLSRNLLLQWWTRERERERGFWSIVGVSKRDKWCSILRAELQVRDGREISFCKEVSRRNFILFNWKEHKNFSSEGVIDQTNRWEGVTSERGLWLQSTFMMN